MAFAFRGIPAIRFQAPITRAVLPARGAEAHKPPATLSDIRKWTADGHAARTAGDHERAIDWYAKAFNALGDEQKFFIPHLNFGLTNALLESGDAALREIIDHPPAPAAWDELDLALSRFSQADLLLRFSLAHSDIYDPPDSGADLRRRVDETSTRRLEKSFGIAAANLKKFVSRQEITDPSVLYLLGALHEDARALHKSEAEVTYEEKLMPHIEIIASAIADSFNDPSPQTIIPSLNDLLMNPEKSIEDCERDALVHIETYLTDTRFGSHRHEYSVLKSYLLFKHHRTAEAASALESALQQFPGDPDILGVQEQFASAIQQFTADQERKRRAQALIQDTEGALGTLRVDLGAGNVTIDEIQEAVQEAVRGLLITEGSGVFESAHKIISKAKSTFKDIDRSLMRTLQMDIELHRHIRESLPLTALAEGLQPYHRPKADAERDIGHFLEHVNDHAQITPEIVERIEGLQMRMASVEERQWGREFIDQCTALLPRAQEELTSSRFFAAATILHALFKIVKKRGTITHIHKPFYSILEGLVECAEKTHRPHFAEPVIGDEWVTKETARDAKKMGPLRQRLEAILSSLPPQETLNESDALNRIRTDFLDPGRYAEGADAYRALQQKFPNSVAASQGLGSCLFHLEQFEDAEAIFRSVLDRDPENWSALYMLGNTLEMRGHTGEALIFLEQAVIRSNYSLHVTLDVAERWATLGRWDDVEKALLVLLEKSSPSAEERDIPVDNALEKILTQYYIDRQTDRAVALCTALASRGLRGKNLLFGWAAALMRGEHVNVENQERFDEAAALLQELIDRFPESYLGYFGMGQLGYARQDYPAAAARYEEAIQRGKSHEMCVEGYTAFGITYAHTLVKEGRLDDAIRHLQKLVEFLPEMDALHSLRFHHAIVQALTAAESYTKALKWGTAHLNTLNHEKELAAYEGTPASDLPYEIRVRRAFIGEIFLTLGLAALRLTRWDEAEKYFDEAKKFDSVGRPPLYLEWFEAVVRRAQNLLPARRPETADSKALNALQKQAEKILGKLTAAFERALRSSSDPELIGSWIEKLNGFCQTCVETMVRMGMNAYGMSHWGWALVNQKYYFLAYAVLHNAAPPDDFPTQEREELGRKQGAAALTLADYIGGALRRPEQALALFEEARRLIPIDGNLLSTGGNLYGYAQRYDEAEKLYRLAIAVEPAMTPSILPVIAMLYIKQGDEPKGTAMLEEVSREYPRNAEAILVHAEYLLQKAKENLDDREKVEKSIALYHEGLARLKADKGHSRRAEYIRQCEVDLAEAEALKE